MLPKVLDIKKIDIDKTNSICVIKHEEMEEKMQIYYAALMIRQVCKYECPAIPREKNNIPIVRLLFDEQKGEYIIMSSEDKKETIEILGSFILCKLLAI